MPEQGPFDGGRLFKDLLVHEGRKAALLGSRQIPVDIEPSVVRLRAGEGRDLGTILGDDHELVLAQLDRVPGVRDERADIAGDEHLTVAHPDHQGRITARRDQHRRGIGMRRNQRERPFQFPADRRHARR